MVHSVAAVAEPIHIAVWHVQRRSHHCFAWMSPALQGDETRRAHQPVSHPELSIGGSSRSMWVCCAGVAVLEERSAQPPAPLAGLRLDDVFDLFRMVDPNTWSVAVAHETAHPDHPAFEAENCILAAVPEGP